MKCPSCNGLEDRVLESRVVQNNEVTRRRRECLQCKHRFTSFERIEERAVMVIKKDESRELFDGKKILKGLIRAFEKRPIELENIERIVCGIERGLKDQKTVEIASDEIGKLILKKVYEIDQVAYIRFASVYRKFDDVKEFNKIVNEILNDKGVGDNDE